MAFTSGTATNHVDLYNKLRDFLVTGMTPIGERWTQISGNAGVLTATDEIVLKGPGLAGTDEILVGLKMFTSGVSDYFNLAFNGLTIWNPALTLVDNQINRSGWKTLHLWDDVIDYWFVASGRRFIVVVRISTFYFASYVGFTLPLALPAQYPYPLFVGAGSDLTTARWSLTSPKMRNFFDACEGGSMLLFPDVVWRWSANWYDFDGTNDGYSRENVNTNPWRWDVTPVRDNLDGSYTLTPAVIVSASPYQAQICRMDGVFHVSGFGNSAGSLVAVGGVNHLVVPNVYRNSWQHFAAIALE